MKPHICRHKTVGWSPKHEGCLMLRDAKGRECCSLEEGEYPTEESARPVLASWAKWLGVKVRS